MGLSSNLDHKVQLIHRQIADFQDDKKSLFASSSFQTHSLPMLHILGRSVADLPVYFIQTGFHFPETLAFRDKVAKEFDLTLKNIESHVPKSQQRNAQGNLYFTSDPDYCCFLNKTQPMQPLLAQFDVWVNGVRADQNANRKNLNSIENTPQGGMRYHPMLDWSRKEIWEYITEMNLPRHPLDNQGYMSIGCEPCTLKPTLGEERDGRWLGQSKTECGLHTELVSK
ncbi:MAG: phosphoadenylyl-sulfate reductase [Flavobacteriales bacterium]|jgi:phosphoadenosine phosphosulfate reductase|nr:phosphoadenylyl-sulfate reductase [Flavobacteriales bacterium]NCG30516.1 phosphoadenylyl-sulfate reductase [Bacteroidota bacterium]MBT5977681.1 phosphoadenylyl-sulfate reductase [Flavobacteriales bacterium]MBT6383002.1 phosphoadenylyl-sulfate reductase [Flavobacteriales bacterium]MBT6917108.1 phosphoadenylyl-sulfate reductase [Flavobacteriales bacterium]